MKSRRFIQLTLAHLDDTNYDPTVYVRASSIVTVLRRGQMTCVFVGPGEEDYLEVKEMPEKVLDFIGRTEGDGNA